MVCPNCRAVIDEGDRKGRSKRKYKTLVKIFIDSQISSDPASQMPEDIPDPMEDPSEDETVDPVKKLKLELDVLQKETRTLALTKKDLVKEVAVMKKRLAEVMEQYEDETGKQEALEQDLLELESRTGHQDLQIAALKDVVKDWEEGQPTLKLELARVRAELGTVTREMEWKVEDSAKRELTYQEMEESMRVDRKQWVQERNQYVQEMAKLVERIGREGSSGGRQIKKLHQEVAQLTDQLSTSVSLPLYRISSY